MSKAKKARPYKCRVCGTNKHPVSDPADNHFKMCPEPRCGYRYRIRLGGELSDAIDGYAAGTVTDEQLKQAGVDQEFGDITRRIEHQEGQQ